MILIDFSLSILQMKNRKIIDPKIQTIFVSENFWTTEFLIGARVWNEQKIALFWKSEHSNRLHKNIEDILEKFILKSWKNFNEALNQMEWSEFMAGGHPSKEGIIHISLTTWSVFILTS